MLNIFLGEVKEVFGSSKKQGVVILTSDPDPCEALRKLAKSQGLKPPSEIQSDGKTRATATCEGLGTYIVFVSIPSQILT